MAVTSLLIAIFSYLVSGYVSLKKEHKIKLHKILYKEKLPIFTQPTYQKMWNLKIKRMLSFYWAWHCVKSVRIPSYSGPHFPAFGPEQHRVRTLFTQCSCRDKVTCNKWTVKAWEFTKLSNFHVSSKFSLNEKCPNMEFFLVRIFLFFGLNTEIFSVNLHIQSKYKKIRTRKTPCLDSFHTLQTELNKRKKLHFWERLIKLLIYLFILTHLFPMQSFSNPLKLSGCRESVHWEQMG